MKQYQFSSELNQSIVNGILQGYKNYIDERKVKNEELRISSAYAWVKGNHIDDQTAEECLSMGITYEKAKAGYTWGYLQFKIGSERKMFIVKNAKYFDEENFPGGRGIRGQKRSGHEENYLKKLSRINKDIDFPGQLSLIPANNKDENYVIFDDQIMKDLDESQVRNLENEYDQFYIITYEIDEGYMISKIRLLMPNAFDNKAYEVQDLSEFIGSSTVDFSDVDTDILIGEGTDYFEETTAAEYEIYHEDEINEEEKGTSD